MTTRETAPARIRDQLARREHLRALERYILEDQWAAGDGWTGPNPTDLDTGSPRDFLNLIEREFVSRNVLNEVITRHRDGVLGREPTWKFTREAGQARLVKEAEEALTSWWDDSGIPGILQAAVRTLLFASERTTAKDAPQPARSPLRLHIKARSIGADGRVPRRSTLAEALADIGLHAAAPYAAGVLRNLDGDPIATHYTYADTDDQHRVEITGIARDLREAGFKVPPGYPDGHTVVLVTTRDFTPVEDAAYDLGGRLLMHELEREPLITSSAISQQKLINKAFTMMSHNMNVAGFTERTFLNAQMPGHWVDEHGERASAEHGGVRFIPDPLHVGAGASNFIAGLPSVGDDGITRYATPSLLYRDPVPPGAFVDTIAAAKLAVLEEAKQLHVALSGDGVASGASRIQAANDFVGSLEMTAVEVNRAVRWALETALSLASVLMGSPRKYDGLRPVAEARLSAVQPTSEDVEATINKRNAGLVSRETAMSEVGVEDVDAEVAKIESERAASAASGTGANPEPPTPPAPEPAPPEPGAE